MDLKRVDPSKEFKISKYTPHALCMHTEEESNMKCAKNQGKFFAGKRNTIKYAAKLNIPLMPSASKCKQVVLGSTKFLLPYLLLPEHFVVLSSKPNVWTEKLNNIYMFCIAMDYFNKNKDCGAMPIRLVTTPEYMRSKAGMRITAKEICQLKNIYNLTFYKLESNEHNNIYFISNVSLKHKRFRQIKIEEHTNTLYFTRRGVKHKIDFIHVHV